MPLSLTGLGGGAASLFRGGGGGAALFEFTSFTFGTGGQSGRTGPTKTQLFATSYYNTSTYPWLNDTSFFNIDSNALGVQMFTVPKDGTYRIVAAGASGGFAYNSNTYNRVGRGAEVRGDFNLTAGTILRIVVGQRGLPLAAGNAPPLNGTSYNSGGGGMSAVFYTLTDTEPLIIGGGGGGAGYDAYSGSGVGRADASTDLTGNPGRGINGNASQYYNGLISGQSLGDGGPNNISNAHLAGGGAGWKGNGGGGNQMCSVQDPYYVQGGWGKSKTLDTSASTTNGGPFMGGWGGNNQAGFGSQLGGFGGGGGGTGRCGSMQAGGGGGYTGGGAPTNNTSSPTKDALAGGGNYVASTASNRTFVNLKNEGDDGLVQITLL